MEYKALFEIDGGISYGFGITYPDQSKSTKMIIADNIFEAGLKAINTAKYLSKQHLTNPNTDVTKVTLVELIDQNGKIIKTEQLEELAQRFRLKIEVEESHIVAKSSLWEHLMDYAKVA